MPLPFALPVCRALLALACLALTCLAGPAMAHSGLGPAAGFGASITYPFGGLDHVAAMVAVGLCGAILGLGFLTGAL